MKYTEAEALGSCWRNELCLSHVAHFEVEQHVNRRVWQIGIDIATLGLNQQSHA